MHLIIDHLLTIFNSCLKAGVFLSCWKEAMVCILRKPKKQNYSDLNSYRPISLLNWIGKLFEKILLNRLGHLSREGKWISNNQHGFQEKKSTETAIHSLVTEVEVGFGKKMSTACALIDIKSAFDTAWAPAILTALGRRNCPGYLLLILKSFLNNRRASLSLQNASLSKARQLYT